ncbi:hypothetical protein LY76DRAFT_86110 [Colletotrichum caudatum]|nr:hypothetical protein LY76DRAFT_86110 [Colletotrichum caudatum]
MMTMTLFHVDWQPWHGMAWPWPRRLLQGRTETRLIITPVLGTYLTVCRSGLTRQGVVVDYASTQHPYGTVGELHGNGVTDPMGGAPDETANYLAVRGHHITRRVR